MDAVTMKALVYKGPGQKSWESISVPKISRPTDAIVRIAKTTICGTDLHILKGDVPAVTDGRILGHEGVGVVEEVGNAVSNFKKGERVIISCITSCGKCDRRWIIRAWKYSGLEWQFRAPASTPKDGRVKF